MSLRLRLATAASSGPKFEVPQSSRARLGTSRARARSRLARPSLPRTRTGPRIFWPYADGGEASLACDGMPDARAFTLDLAERLEFRPGQELRVPVVFGTVPDGLHPAYAARTRIS